MTTWKDWLVGHKLHECVPLPDDVLDQVWQPTEDDRNAAWDLYTELRTRSTTQPLPYRAGDEASALESLYQIFGLTRELLHKYQRPCAHFSTLSVAMLNGVLRPFTTKWHKVKEAGRLSNEDVRRDFRAALMPLQKQLSMFQRLLGQLTEGKQFKEDIAAKYLPKKKQEFDLGKPIAPAKLPGVAQPDVFSSELADVVARRKKILKQPNANTDDLVGLAISGGGIRSATFALGIVQCLAERNFLGQVDYLSTVSGGGYIGSFLSSYLNSDNPDVGPGPAQLPFKKIEQNEAPPIRHLRNHSKYLVEGTWSNHLRSGGQALYGVLTNLLIVTPFIFLLVLLTGWCLGEDIYQAMMYNLLVEVYWGTIVGVGGLAVLLAGLAIVQSLARLGHGWVKFRDRYETFAAWWFAGACIALAINLLPLLFAGYNWMLGEAWGWIGMALSLLSPPVIGSFVVLAKKYPIISKILMQFFWFSGPLAFLILYFSLTRRLIFFQMDNAYPCFWTMPIPLVGEHYWELWGFLVADVGLITYCFLFLNVNLTSPHRFYRDQLSHAYLLSHGTDGKPKPNDLQKLSTLGTSEKAPYHLINGALNLSQSDRVDLRGRDADFFLYSKHFCGSQILGYFPTKDWETLDGHVNLGTAMAISGAAAAPIMGMASIFGASFLLALLNVRLSYWMRDANPKKDKTWDIMPGPLSGPGPRYVLKEMFDDTDDTTRYVNVSDGGHLENLGVYELLRRRCKFIIALDGECDPLMQFPSLIQVTRFAEIDFGFHIQIDLSDLRLDPATGFSKAHYALGTIDYGNGEQGLLLYLKSSLTGNEADYILAYKAQHLDFPHESTLDQLYEEDQFEAYRALGHHAATALFRSELLVTELGPNPSVKDWFQRLANSLL